MPRFCPLRCLTPALLLLALAGCALPGREPRPDTESSPEFARIPGAVAAPAPAVRTYPCTLEVRKTADGPALPQPALIAPGEAHVWFARCRENHVWVEVVTGFTDDGASNPIPLDAAPFEPGSYLRPVTMPLEMPPGTEIYITLLVDGRYSGEVQVRVTTAAPRSGGR